MISPSKIRVVEVSKKLKEIGNKATGKRFEKYHKGAYQSHGVYSKDLDAFFAKEFERNNELEKELALSFFESNFLEEKMIGVNLWNFGDEAIRTEVFENNLIKGWAICDGICGRVLRKLVHSDESARNRIASWGKDATSLWTVRASCVAFITTTKQKNCRAPAMKALSYAINDSKFANERFVQLGAGWLLREIGQHEKATFNSFLRENLASFSSEGLRYAIEKLPSSERHKWMDKRKSIVAEQLTSKKKINLGNKCEE